MTESNAILLRQLKYLVSDGFPRVKRLGLSKPIRELPDSRQVEDLIAQLLLHFGYPLEVKSRSCSPTTSPCTSSPVTSPSTTQWSASSASSSFGYSHIPPGTFVSPSPGAFVSPLSQYSSSSSSLLPASLAQYSSSSPTFGVATSASFPPPIPASFSLSPSPSPSPSPSLPLSSASTTTTTTSTTSPLLLPQQQQLHHLERLHYQITEKEVDQLKEYLIDLLPLLFFQSNKNETLARLVDELYNSVHGGSTLHRLTSHSFSNPVS